MTIATQYAQALHSLTQGSPEKGKIYLTNLKQVLHHRGHEKLLPQIFSELQKLELKGNRETARGRTSQDSEQTRILLELYRKLITS